MFGPEVRWFNQQETKFFILDQDNFSTYQLDETNNEPSTSDVKFQGVCPTTTVPLGVILKPDEHIRCMDLDYSLDNVLALGYSTGRIFVGKAEIDTLTRSLKGEDIRETQKPISCLAWHPVEKSRLCSIFERGRALDHGVVVYDMNRATRGPRDPPAHYETTTSEKVYSATWFTDDVSILGISTSKSLRLFDMRDSNRATNSISTQQPYYGLCSEQMEGLRFAGHFGNTVHIYDRRYLIKPFYEVKVPVSDNSNLIQRLLWHPHRLFHLSCLVKEGKGLSELVISSKAYQTDAFDRKDKTNEMIKQSVEQTAADYSYRIFSLAIPGIHKVASFDWHPSLPSKLVAISRLEPRQDPTSTRHIRVITHNRSVLSAMGNSEDFVYAFQNSMFILSPPKKPSFDGETNENGVDKVIHDVKTPIIAPKLLPLKKIFDEKNIITIMQERAHRGYGYGNVANPLESVIMFSKTVIDDDWSASSDLKYCWSWVKRMYEFPEESKLAEAYGSKFPGVFHIADKFINDTVSDTRIDPVLYRVRIFTNPHRERILQLCGWPTLEEIDSYRGILEEITQRRIAKDLSRAAAVAIFSCQGPLCKEYLERLLEHAKNRTLHSDLTGGDYNKHCESYEKMAETVLDTFRSFKGTEIADFETRVNNLTDDHLKAIIKYLARRAIGYTKILNEIINLKGIEFEDKLLLANINMDDANFKKALETICNELWESNPLKSLLIIGLDDHERSHTFLQRYAERTKDFQTVAILLIVGECMKNSPIFKEPKNVCIKIEDLAMQNIRHETNLTRTKSIFLLFEYIDLLNKWGLWIERTFLTSLIRKQYRAQKNVPPQAVIACNFCGVPVYPPICGKLKELCSTSINYKKFNTYAGRSRMMSCASCRKPLPKCTICRRHYGSHIELTVGNELPSAIDHWFVWCCHCNHGGHLAHIKEWFDEYTICPASGCDCNCMERDHLLKEQFVEAKSKFFEDIQRDKPPVPRICTSRTNIE